MSEAPLDTYPMLPLSIPVGSTPEVGLSTAKRAYRGTSLISKHQPLGPYSRPTPRALWESAVSYGQGTPVSYTSPNGLVIAP